jgi:hypothetical protein
MALPPPPPGLAQYPAPLHPNPVINDLYQAHPEIIPQQQANAYDALQHLIQQPQQQANAYNALQYQQHIPPPQYQQEGEDVDDLYGEGIRHRHQKFRKSRKPIRKSRKSSRKSRKSRRVKRY